jgi:opacity protein-like surface antigen
MHKAFILVVSIVVLSLAATAQESRSEISVQGTGFFTKTTSGNGASYSATDSAGFLGTYRYHVNRWISAEAAYGYTSNTQSLLASNTLQTQSGIHQFTGSVVVNLPSRASSRFRPYVLAGGGALLFTPSGVQTQTKGAFVYGAGINYALLKRVSLRAEYRGLVYGAPGFEFGAVSTVTHTAEPSIGLSYRF